MLGDRTDFSVPDGSLYHGEYNIDIAEDWGTVTPWDWVERESARIDRGYYSREKTVAEVMGTVEIVTETDNIRMAYRSRSKITFDIADEIRSMREKGARLHLIAICVGLSMAQVHTICSGKNWRPDASQLPRKRTSITPELRDKIMAMYHAGIRQCDISDKLDIAPGTISLVVRKATGRYNVKHTRVQPTVLSQEQKSA